MADEIIENIIDTVDLPDASVDGGTAAAVGESPVAAAPAPTPADQPVDAQFLLPPRPAGVTDADWYEQLAANHHYLHTEINAIAPIDGISGSAQDIRTYYISFKAEATEEQRAAAWAALLTLPKKLEQKHAKAAALSAIDAWFNEQIAEGFRMSGGLQLGLKTEDITLLTGNFIMAQQAAAMGLPLPPIIDMNGLTYSFANIEELTRVMLAYGQHRANLAMYYAARKAEVEAEFADVPVPADTPDTAG